MACNWVKSLWGVQVGPAPHKVAPGWFIIPVILNGEEVEALIDAGCGWTLVRKSKGPLTPEWLWMQCIHGNMRISDKDGVHLNRGAGIHQSDRDSSEVGLWGTNRP